MKHLHVQDWLYQRKGQIRDEGPPNGGQHLRECDDEAKTSDVSRSVPGGQGKKAFLEEQTAHAKMCRSETP